MVGCVLASFSLLEEEEKATGLDAFALSVVLVLFVVGFKALVPATAAALGAPEATATFFTELGAPLDHAFFMAIKELNEESNELFLV